MATAFSDRSVRPFPGKGHPLRTIVWIASYPKSGNTWVRWLLCNLMGHRIKSAGEMEQIVPDIHQSGAPTSPPAQITCMKTHFPCSIQLPMLAHTAAAVYMIRHPMDVMASNVDYARRGIAGGMDEPMAVARYMDEFIAHGGVPYWIGQGFGTWQENVWSWTGYKQPFPVLVLRYEQMLQDAHGAAGQLNDFLGLGKSAVEIREAVEASTFERMAEAEESDIRQKKSGVFYDPNIQSNLDAGHRFMRSGKAGRGKQALSPEQRQRFLEVFGASMRQLGYDQR